MAADYVKYGAPLASSMALLAWSYVEFGQGYEQVGVVQPTTLHAL
jgi:hypothetical protein